MLTAGVTGGSLPATAWHSFMSVAHTNRNIPPIQGLPPHPAQVAEQQRLAELKRTDPGLAQAQIAQATQKKISIMPDQTRDALKRLADPCAAPRQQATPASAPAAQPEPAPPPAAAPAARDPQIAPPAAKQGSRRTDAHRIPASACGLSSTDSRTAEGPGS